MAKKKITTNWLAFNIDMPAALIPLYDYLQSELDTILSDTKYRKQLLNLDLSKHRGNIWRDMRDLFRDRVKTWPIHNKTWYSYMLYENLRRELQSKDEATIIYNTLKVNNNNTINEELMDKLHAKHVYSTFARISNIQRSKNKPKLPKHAVFNLDYSVSAAQNFTMDTDNHCRIQLLDGSWLDYDIYLPTSLHKTLTGKIAKPRFIKRKRDNQYIGVCSFEYTPYSNNNNGNVLGVDIGQVKLFTAIALKPNGLYGNEYIESHKSRHLQNELNKLYTAKQNLANKINNVDSFLNNEDYKQTKRLVEYNEISNKITNLKTVIARNIAKEVVSVAVLEKCKEIHIENLSWMGSLGGKWNHEQIHGFIIEQARKYSIKVIKVNARDTSGTNPITNELGTKNNRTVTFRDTKKIDRDTLAAINIASRNRGKQKDNHVKYLKHKATPSRRVKTNKSRKQEIKQIVKQINRDTEIVVFCPQQRTLFNERLWSVTDSNYQANNSLLTCLYKCVNLLHC